MAERQGLRVEKSRRRDPHALDYGCYWITDPAANAVIAGAGPTGRPWLSLDEVEEFLTTPPAERG